MQTQQNIKVRKFDEQKERVETGPIQFGDDWPGVFFRGDNALYFGYMLNSLLNNIEIAKDNIIITSVLKGLANDLTSCDYRSLRNEEENENSNK